MRPAMPRMRAGMPHADCHIARIAYADNLGNLNNISAERLAVDLRKPVFLYCRKMRASSVAFMLVETIPGKNFMEFCHFSVASYLGNNRSGGDKRNFFVAFDNSPLAVLGGREKSAVEQNKTIFSSQFIVNSYFFEN